MQDSVPFLGMIDRTFFLSIILFQIHLKISIILCKFSNVLEIIILYLGKSKSRGNRLLSLNLSKSELNKRS